MKVADLFEIDHDDSVYSKKASHHVLAGHKLDSTWVPLMKVDGYEFVWKEVGPEYRVIMKDGDGSPLLRLELRVRTAKVPGGNLVGVITDSLSSHEKVRGKGMALKMYKALVEHGQVLFSSNSQTSGSRKLWEQLVETNVGEVFVLAEGAAARFYARRAGRDDEQISNVLLTGAGKSLNDEAYASSETRWVLLPHDLDGLNTLRKAAIKLS